MAVSGPAKQPEQQERHHHDNHDWTTGAGTEVGASIGAMRARVG